MMRDAGRLEFKAADQRVGLIEYASDRREMIRHPEFIANGWHIGSGAMESECRVIPDRVKGPGKRCDAAAYFASVPEPTSTALLSIMGLIGLRRPSRRQRSVN